MLYRLIRQNGAKTVISDWKENKFFKNNSQLLGWPWMGKSSAFRLLWKLSLCLKLKSINKFRQIFINNSESTYNEFKVNLFYAFYTAYVLTEGLGRIDTSCGNLYVRKKQDLKLAGRACRQPKVKRSIEVILRFLITCFVNGWELNWHPICCSLDRLPVSFITPRA